MRLDKIVKTEIEVGLVGRNNLLGYIILVS